jgi:hypothetical protein
MAKNDSRLLSGRIKTKSGNTLDSRRTTFLSLDNAEPNFGNPDSDRYILASLANGERLFLKLNKGFLVSADSVSGDESTFEIDPSGLANAVGTTLADVLDDLDSAITLAFGSGVIHDANFNGAGTVESQLSLDSDLRIFGITGDSATFTNITRTGTTVTAGTYGSVTEIPVLTVDASGFVDSIGEVSISTTLNTSGETGTGSVSLLDSALNIAAGEGINTVASGNTVTVSGEDASTTNKGVAHFDSGDFTVSSGYVSVKTSGIDNDQLAGEITNDKLVNTTITLGSTTVALGDSSNNLTIDSADITKLDVTGTATLASASVTDLTDNRVVIVGTSGELEDDANLTYDGSTLTVANNTASTNSANGALVVTGGVGIGGALNVNGNTEIAGNLTVTGTTTTIEVQTLAIQDPLIHLADSNESGDEVDIGFIGHYYDAALGGRQHTGFFRDATDDKYYLFAQYQDSALDSSPRSNIIDRSDPSFVLADLNVATIVADTFSGTVSADSITTTNFTATSVDINGGTIDGTTIATSDITVGASKTLDVSAGTLTLANDQISGDKVEGGTINAVTINNLTSGNVNIDGGFIDGIAIGHTTADSGTFTNLARTSPSGVTAGAYGSVTEIPVITLDASGFVDSIGQVAISTTLNTAAETGTGTVNLLDSSLEIAAGEGINTTASGRTITISGEDASTSNKGIASFASGDFDVSSGAVSIKAAGVGNVQLENDDVTVTAGSGILGGGSVALGNSVEVKLDSGAVKGLFSGGNNIDYNNSTGEISASVSGVVAGTYGTSTKIPIISVDSYGQVDSIGLVGAQATLGDTVDSIFHSPLTGEFRLVTDVATFFTDIVLDPYTTDSLSEGTTNLYYTKTRVDSDIDQAFNENPSFGGTGAPFSVANDTKITNLNADKLDGYSFDDFLVLNLPAIKTNGDVRFNDDVLLTFGQSDDLRIYHDQNTSYINEIGTGDLKILTNGQSIILEDSTNDKVSGQFTPSGSVDLYYNGSKKFETTNTGVTVTGIIAADSGTLNNNRILTTADEGSGNGLDADTLDGINSTSFLRSDATDTKTAGDLKFADNVKATFGSADELQISYSGSLGMIKNLTGHMYIRNIADDKSIFIQTDDGSGAHQTYFKAEGITGEAILYHYGSEKLATKSTGIDVVGNITVTGIIAADSGTLNNNRILTTADEGSGNGLDADTLDGLQSIQFLRSDQDDSIAGTLFIDDSLSANNITRRNTTVTAGTYGSITAIPVLTVDASGFVDSVGTTALSTVLSTTAETGTGSVNLLDSALEIAAGSGIDTVASGNTVTVEIDSADLAAYFSKAIVHDNTNGFVADEHVAHSSIDINAGNGLTGGGNIASDVTIDIDSANVRAMFSGGDGLTYNNGTGEFTVVGGDGITANANDIEVTVDNSTIEINGSSQVGVKNLGITNAKLEGSIENAKLSNSSVTVGSTNIALGATQTTLADLTQVDVTGQVNVDNIRIDGNTISSTAGSYMYIDPHPVDSAGTLVILGNLSVEGTTTTIKSTTVNINDKNIVLADSASSNVEANGAGITVNGSNATITYDGGTDRWDFNKPIEVSTVHGALSGNATTATTATTAGALSSAVTVELSGDVSGSATFTSAGDTANISTTIQPNSVALGTDTTGNYVASLVAGNLIDLQNNSGENATPTIDVDLSELTDMTGAAVETDELVILDAGSQKRKAISEITLGLFNTTDQIALGTDTTGNYVQQGATSGNGISGSVNSEGGTFTVTSNATNANTGNTIVFRDASGNFSAETISAALSGNASTATALASSQNFSISGDITASAVGFDGTGAVALSAAITAGSIVNADINTSAAIADTKLATISTSGKVSNTATTATSANTNSAIVARDVSGDFIAGTITATLNGNASTATTATSATTATNANNVAITDDTSTNSTHYVHFGDATSLYDNVKVSSSKLTFNPSSGTLQVNGISVATTADITAATSPNFSVDSAYFGTGVLTNGEGKAVYYDTSTNKWEGAYNDSSGEFVASHVIVDKAATDVKVASTGIFTLSGGLNANHYYFLSSTAGTATDNPDIEPKVFQPLYYALDANTIDLNIQAPQDTVITTYASGNNPGEEVHGGPIIYTGIPSDERLKENIESIQSDAISIVNELNPVSFDFKDPRSKYYEGQQLGFIAQEISDVIPQSVYTEDDEIQTMMLKPETVIPVLRL